MSELNFRYTSEIHKIKRGWWRKPYWEVVFYYDDEFYRVVRYNNESDATDARYDWTYGDKND